MSEESHYQPPTFITLALRENWGWGLLFFWGGYFMFTGFGNGFLAVLFSVAVMGWGAYTLVMIYLRVAAKADLYRDGKHTEATVTEVRDVSKTINALPHVRLVFEFTTEEGETYPGETKALPLTVSEKFQVGDKLPIIYDAEDPLKSLWIEEDMIEKSSFFWRMLGR